MDPLRKILSFVAVILLTGCDLGDEPETLTRVQAFMQDPLALERGEALFAGTCADLCHARTAAEDDSAYLFDCQWDHGSSDEEIFAIISSGIPDTRMVGFGTNFPEGEDDKWKIIAFLRANQEPCQ